MGSEAAKQDAKSYDVQVHVCRMISSRIPTQGCGHTGYATGDLYLDHAFELAGYVADGLYPITASSQSMLCFFFRNGSTAPASASKRCTRLFTY
jgi:hypothetical protein